MKILFLFLLFLFWGIELFIYMYGKKEEEVKVDYILILGCALKGENLCNALQRRVDKALLYAKKYPAIPIIVSGGKGKDEVCSEAYAMKKYLINHGICADRILMEDKSVCTYTNFQCTKSLLNGSSYKLLVTTCDFHMYRSIALGKRAGFTCYRWPAKSTTLYSIKNYIREFFCILYFWVLKK